MASFSILWVKATHRLVFMVAEALPFKTCEKCFAGAYAAFDFSGNSHGRILHAYT